METGGGRSWGGQPYQEEVAAGYAWGRTFKVTLAHQTQGRREKHQIEPEKKGKTKTGENLEKAKLRRVPRQSKNRGGKRGVSSERR